MKDEKKNILVPIEGDAQTPPLNKLIKLARVTKSKIHLAGFMPGGDLKIDQLIKHTISLTKKVNQLATGIRDRGGVVSSKIYMNSFNRKASQVVNDQDIGIITTLKLSNGKLGNTSKNLGGTLHLMFSEGKEIRQTNDILVLHTIKKDQSKLLATISRLFGSKLYALQKVSKEAVEDIRKYFDKPLDPKINKTYTLKELKVWLNTHKPALIAMKKDEVEKDSQGKKILNAVETPVLLY